jgi:uncharacterized LabA/DUF88 family protein
MAKALFAILLDGGFLTRKIQAYHHRPATAADIVAYCDRLKAYHEVAQYELLRTYYYDAHPSTDTVTYPVSRNPYNLATTPRYRQSQSLFDSLVMKPGFALRMGEVRVAWPPWRIKSSVVTQLLAMPRALADADFSRDLGQKGVDMRIGLDMARLALRELVRAVVVVTGDSDFVPAFKFVRREGVKVILVTLAHGRVRQELKAHADFVINDPYIP